MNILKIFTENRFFRGCKGNGILKEDLPIYISQGAILIDVRSPQEYREGHIKNSIYIPDYEINKRIQNKNQLIVLYCSNGYRIKKLQCILEKMGYNNVYNLE